MAERKYILRGQALTAAQVADLENVTDAEKQAFAQQAGMSDARLKEIEAMVEAMVPPLREFIKKSVQPVVDHLVELRKKVAEIEDRPAIEWGVFDETKDYRAGVFVTSGGSMWFSRTASKGMRPGAGNDVWKLCVKRGDAK